MKNVTIENTEIRDQAHEMWAEGITDEMATQSEIEETLNKQGYTGNRFDMWVDTSQGFYRWRCDITKLQNDEFLNGRGLPLSFKGLELPIKVTILSTSNVAKEKLCSDNLNYLSSIIGTSAYLIKDNLIETIDKKHVDPLYLNFCPLID